MTLLTQDLSGLVKKFAPPPGTKPGETAKRKLSEPEVHNKKKKTEATGKRDLERVAEDLNLTELQSIVTINDPVPAVTVRPVQQEREQCSSSVLRQALDTLNDQPCQREPCEGCIEMRKEISQLNVQLQTIKSQLFDFIGRYQSTENTTHYLWQQFQRSNALHAAQSYQPEVLTHHERTSVHVHRPQAYRPDSVEQQESINYDIQTVTKDTVTQSSTPELAEIPSNNITEDELDTDKQQGQESSPMSSEDENITYNGFTKDQLQQVVSKAKTYSKAVKKIFLMVYTQEEIKGRTLKRSSNSNRPPLEKPEKLNIIYELITSRWDVITKPMINSRIGEILKPSRLKE